MHRLGLVLSIAVLIVMAADTGAQAESPAEVFKQGCGGCHTSERTILRRIPKRPDAERRAWIEAFMALHPCEHDEHKAAIVDYLLARSRR